MENNFELTEEEKETIAEYYNSLNDTKLHLGNLRAQYIFGEASLMDKINTTEKELVTHLREVAQSKGINMEENWGFDASTFFFVRKD